MMMVAGNAHNIYAMASRLAMPIGHFLWRIERDEDKKLLDFTCEIHTCIATSP